jgi:hypothetical protein
MWEMETGLRSRSHHSRLVIESSIRSASSDQEIKLLFLDLEYGKWKVGTALRSRSTLRDQDMFPQHRVIATLNCV